MVEARAINKSLSSLGDVARLSRDPIPTRDVAEM